MEASTATILTHPAGESATSPSFPSGSWPVDTPGGRFHAEWDDQAPVTREGQLIFFFQFLHVGGRWAEFLRGCPLHYTGNRGSGARNVMGTALLSILCGHWRYAHINGVRGDGINPGLLGMAGTVSEDAVRLGIGRIEEKPGLDWLSGQILGSIAPALTPLNDVPSPWHKVAVTFSSLFVVFRSRSNHKEKWHESSFLNSQPRCRETKQSVQPRRDYLDTLNKNPCRLRTFCASLEML